MSPCILATEGSKKNQIFGSDHPVLRTPLLVGGDQIQYCAREIEFANFDLLYLSSPIQVRSFQNAEHRGQRGQFLLSLRNL